MESQVTSQTPATRPAKNSKRVAAGKRVAEKTRLAREAHKQKADMYDKLVAKESAPAPDPAPAPAPAPEPSPPAASDSNGFTTNQLISIAGIIVALVTTYVKRDDIKAFFGKEKATPPEPQPKEPPPQPQPQPQPQPRKGIRKMD